MLWALALPRVTSTLGVTDSMEYAELSLSKVHESQSNQNRPGVWYVKAISGIDGQGGLTEFRGSEGTACSVPKRQSRHVSAIGFFVCLNHTIKKKVVLRFQETFIEFYKKRKEK